MTDAAYWIEKLGLSRHPEGGWYRESYRAEESIEGRYLPRRFSGPRSLSTAIYFLLEAGDFSAFHRLKADEIWHFYDGGPLAIHALGENGFLHGKKLGRDHAGGQVLQLVIPAGSWFAAEVANASAYALVGCTVSPGFDFRDFELGDRRKLEAAFPSHAGLIGRLSR